VGEAMGLVKIGTVSPDGTKIKANASKHKALSWDYANRLEAQLKQEVEELMRLAEEADQCSRPEEMDIPEELKRREERLTAIVRAKEEIQARAQARFEREQAEYEAKQAKREAREKETGKKPRGKAPTPPTPGPQAKDQVNLTDEESRIMPTASGGFEQAYNVQAGVDVEAHLIVEQHVTQHTNDKQEIEPALEGSWPATGSPRRSRQPLGRHGVFQRGQCREVHGRKPRSLHPGKARETQSSFSGTFRRGSRTSSECHCGAGHETSLADP
jgi:hypothetical protein